MANAVSNVEASIVILIVGSLVSLLFARRRKLCGWVSFAFVCASSVYTGLAVVGAFTMASGEHTILSLPQLGSSFSLRIDPLSAIFLAIVAVIALLSTLYSVRYMDHYPHDNVAKFFPVLLLCVASMTGVLVCTDFLFFLIFWESMTLTSYFLVTFESENAASQRAGLKYFIITHGATLCMVAAGLFLWRTSGSFAFDAIRQTLSALLVTRPLLAHTIIFLFFLGFATKAGILPMGDWLPDAHPVAPSGMSATLSGALVKLGIYGLIRVFCSFLVVSPSLRVWGIILALAGTGSLFVGTLTALRQTDTKRLMAFHTIGQIGYICLGLGVGIYCLGLYPALATIALAGTILHAVNHACFKSCLFLGAGSVLYRTGKRDMDQLGGLARFMPFTTGATAIASLSIAGVPPLNGFVSKWLIVAACLLTGMRFPLFLVLGLIALFISLATLASFLKVLASVFLGNGDESRGVEEVPNIHDRAPGHVGRPLRPAGNLSATRVAFCRACNRSSYCNPGRGRGCNPNMGWPPADRRIGSRVLVAPRHAGGLGSPGVALLCDSARGRGRSPGPCRSGTAEKSTLRPWSATPPAASICPSNMRSRESIPAEESTCRDSPLPFAARSILTNGCIRRQSKRLTEPRTA